MSIPIKIKNKFILILLAPICISIAAWLGMEFIGTYKDIRMLSAIAEMRLICKNAPERDASCALLQNQLHQSRILCREDEEEVTLSTQLDGYTSDCKIPKKR